MIPYKRKHIGLNREYLLGKFPVERVCPYKIATPRLVPYTVLPPGISGIGIHNKHVGMLAISSYEKHNILIKEKVRMWW